MLWKAWITPSFRVSVTALFRGPPVSRNVTEVGDLFQKFRSQTETDVVYIVITHTGRYKHFN